MIDEKLKKELTRKMHSGDNCNTRILYYMPLLERETCTHMVEDKVYDYPQAFLDVVKSWNKERIIDISTNFNYFEKIRTCINEIIDFYDVISRMYIEYQKRCCNIEDYKAITSNISLRNYIDILKLCRFYNPKKSISKLQSRVSTFKSKFNKVIKGKLTEQDFFEYEIKTQKEELEKVIKMLGQFDYSDFPIFILAFDLKKFRGRRR